METQREICSICGTGIEEDAIQAALDAALIHWKRHEVEAFHLECAIADGSWVSADEITADDREHGVYLIEKL